MSRKSDIANQLKRETGAIVISRKQLAGSLGYRDPHYVDKYLRYLTPVVGKKYLITEVAEEILRIGGK